MNENPQPKPKDFKKYTPNPLLKGLPKYLQDPANYYDIKKKIWETLQGTCSHAEIYEMATCPKCSEKMLERRKLLKNLGFKNPQQYREWDKTHQEVRKRFPLVDWKSRKFIVPNDFKS